MTPDIQGTQSASLCLIWVSSVLLFPEETGRESQCLYSCLENKSSCASLGPSGVFGIRMMSQAWVSFKEEFF